MLLKRHLYKQLGIPGLFGLSKGQSIGGPDLLLSSTFWFNAAGNPLGYGDISFASLISIRDGLPPDECMVIMTQHEGGLRADIQAIPPEALATLAMFIITNEEIYYVDKRGDSMNIGTTVIPGITYSTAEALLQRFLPLPE